MSLLVKFNIVLVLVFAVALVPASFFTYRTVQRNARGQVIQDARIMMETAMAMRGYTIEQVKPLLQDRLAEQFLPQTVPAYSATEIFNNLRKLHPEYSYKEATLNPSNPRNRTVDWEADIVSAFRNDAARTEIIGERDTPEGRSLFLSRPIRITDAKCLACHSTPDRAPASMIRVYGPNNGFGWQLGEVIGAQVVSVPMTLPVTMANTAFQALLVSLVGVFAFTLLVLNLLLRFVIIRPLRELSSMADQVSRGNMDLPDVNVPGRDEVALLAGSFNRMRISLGKALAMLDEG
jgi:HAMP domain-containing protein